MKYSVLITADRRSPGLLSFVTGGLFFRALFPEFFSSEAMGAHTVRLRIELDCDERTMLGLREYWEVILRVQAVVTTPALPADGPSPAGHVPAPTFTDLVWR
ncbi:hypothetical protein [Opitutus sp. GAS368]|uniref:hypothetical protein n=1 Tax=Opitutus sp. GAS368 TaxID=1882749 RepID=UPI00087DBA96|nr:hypothetical protein [Opitutus sp. GAS368]SDS05030.1 hypothetical protein SAMN05444173_1738 [Opitutus sp. GAS368]